MMWMLVNESATEAQQFFLHQGTLTIGRAAPDIGIILTDKSISRKHATLCVGAFDPSGSLEALPPITITDSSKFGTQLDGVPLLKGQAVSLSQGKLLRIGLHIHLRVVWDRVVACTGSPAAATSLATAAWLGIHLTESWHPQCTHLVTAAAPSANSAAAACAAASGRPFVQATWLDACHKTAVGQSTAPWPAAAAFMWPQPPLPQQLTVELHIRHPQEAALDSGRFGVARQPGKGLLEHWALSWHHSCQDPQLHQAAQLAGAAAAAPDGTAPPGTRLLLVTADYADINTSVSAAISADLLAAAIVDGRAEVLETALQGGRTLSQAPHAGAQPSMPVGTIGLKRPPVLASSARGKRQKKGGKNAAALAEAEDDAFDPRLNAAAETDNDVADGCQPMSVDITVLEQPLVHSPHQKPRQQEAQQATATALNFKRFNKRGSNAPRLATISFAADTWAHEPANNSAFAQQDMEAGQQEAAGDALFAANIKPTGFQKPAATRRPPTQLSLKRKKAAT